MPRRVTVFVPTEGVPAGSVALVEGPAGPVSNGVRKVAGIDSNDVPEAFGPAGQETLPARINSDPLVYGLKSFSARMLQRDTDGEAGGTPPAVDVFISAKPIPPRSMVATEALVGGCMEFRFDGGQLT